MQPQLLTIDEASKVLRISVPTLRRWIRLGVIPSRKLGRRRLIPREAIEKAVREGVDVRKS